MAKINVAVSQMGIIVLLLFTRVSMVANSTVLDAKIDLVIIAPAAAYGESYNGFKDSIRGLPDIIVMNDQKVRVGVVEYLNNGRVLFNLSGNKDDLIQWVDDWIPLLVQLPADRFDHGKAFQKIDTELVFDYKKTDRAKMIMQPLTGWTSDKAAAKAAAENLREKGVLIYLTYAAADKKFAKTSEHKDDAKAYVGENYPWRMHGSERPELIDMWTMALEDIFEHIENITRDLCTFCKFTDTKQAGCKPDKRSKESDIDFFGDKNAKCEKINPTGIPCPMEECQYECDRQWPWTSRCTDQYTTPCVDRHKRVGNVMVGLENCQKEMRCNYTCPTTTTPNNTANQVKTTPNAANQVKTTKPEDSKMPLIIILSVIGGVIIIVIVLIVIFMNRAAAAKKKAMRDLEQLQKKRAEDKAKHKHHIVTAGGKKGVRDAMAVSLVSTMESVKPIPKSPRSKIGGKSRKMGGGTSSPMKKVG